MRLEYMGLSALSGSLIALEGVSGAAYDETAEITLPDGTRRTGRVIRLEGDKAILQVFEGTRGLSPDNARTHFTGEPVKLPLSTEMLGRIFDGTGRPLTAWGNSTRRSAGTSTARPSTRCPGTIPGTASRPASRPSTAT